MTRMHEDARRVIVEGAIKFFADVMLDPVTGQARIENVYTDERPDWQSGAIDADTSDEITEQPILDILSAWTFEDQVTVEFEYSTSSLDLSDKGPFIECDHEVATYDKREGWYVCDRCGQTNVQVLDVDDEDDEDPLDPDERDRVEALKLASERNPDIAWTQADMEDH